MTDPAPIAADPHGWGLVMDHAGRGARVGLGRVAPGSSAERGDVELHADATTPSRRHQIDVLAAADRLLAAAGLGPHNLSWVGWVTGPGSFTGLRVAASTVQMLALARKSRPELAPLRVVGVPATDALLAGEPGATVALAVKRERAWVASAALAPALRPLALARADADARSARLLADPPHGDAPADIDLARLFALAFHRVRGGGPTEPADLHPLYPREPEAVTLWREREG